MASSSTNSRDIPDPASEEQENSNNGFGNFTTGQENSTDDFERFIEDEACNFIMGAPLSQLKEAPLGIFMGVSNIKDTVSQIYSNCQELDHGYYRPLYHAAVKGDWEAANCFLEANPDAATARVSVFGSTALHVAAIEGHGEFVEKLLEVMPQEEVALPDAFGKTALHHAAGAANMKSVEALVRRHPNLTQSMDHMGWTPLLYAVGGSRRKEMSSSRRLECEKVMWFLSTKTTDEEPGCPFSGPEAGTLSFLLTYGGHYDLSLHLLELYPNLLVAVSRRRLTALHGFAMRPTDFYSGCKYRFWENLIYSFVPVQPNHAPPHGITGDMENNVDLVEEASLCSSESQVFCQMRSFAWKAIEYLVPSVKNVKEAKLRHQEAVELLTYIFTQYSRKKINELVEVHKVQHAIGIAAAFGVVEMISICIQFIPDLIWFPTPEGYIMEIAVKQRRDKIFTLMNDGALRTKQGLAHRVLLTGRGNMLHIAAELAPTPQLTSVPGAAFQIQRELLWFREVKKLISPAYRVIRNEDGKIPWEVFMEEHKELLEKGEKWMKETSNYLMVVTTLIASVVFSAAVNVPGGRNGGNGIPIFLWDISFMVFVIADALALFCSVTALLMFLSILTARFAPEDFLKSLPKRLIKGLASLFFAIVAVMIAFGATLSIMLAERWKWTYVPVILLASFPAIMFVKLELPLFIQMIRSTYGSGIFRPQKTLVDLCKWKTTSFCFLGAYKWKITS